LDWCSPIIADVLLDVASEEGNREHRNWEQATELYSCHGWSRDTDSERLCRLQSGGRASRWAWLGFSQVTRKGYLCKSGVWFVDVL